MTIFCLIVSGQIHWALRCLKRYTENPPYKTNLDPFVDQIRKELYDESKQNPKEDEENCQFKSKSTFLIGF
jgi:hypothetical protein